jgi:hypothetical protein
MTNRFGSQKRPLPIFSLKIMKRQYGVTYDSSDTSFLVHRKGSGLSDIIFQEHSNGLHLFDGNSCVLWEFLGSRQNQYSG